MTLALVPVDSQGVHAARRWRNASMAGLRTPHPLNVEMQEEFYRDVICNRQASARYWMVEGSRSMMLDGIAHTTRLDVAMVGLNPIQWENGCGELSLVVDPAEAGKGTGAAAVALVLAEAFDRLRLLTVHAECYESNPALGFWRKMAERWGAWETVYPRRKFWNGRLVDSVLFTFPEETWRERR